MPTDGVRKEHDTLGEVRVPAEAHWGAQTQRAAENFTVSGVKFPRRFIRALAQVKVAAAHVNKEIKAVKPEIGDAIIKAGAEVAGGQWDGEFPLDIFQTGSGTSTNMNANEVIASRANEILGGVRGDREPVRPNDDVNRGQSSNDVIPTVIHLAALEAVDVVLLPALKALAGGLDAKAGEFSDVLKSGRTHLMDAVPMMLGQEFSGWAEQVRKGIVRVKNARESLLELPIGGTALGTGLNAPADFGKRMCGIISTMSGLPVREPANRFESMAARDAVVEMSAALKVVAVSLFKVASDIRLLASGPRTGLGEINLPELQPGSSIMPGKVNPVMPEMMTQVCAQVIGNDAAVTVAGMTGALDLNTMMPVMARNLLESIEILGNACRLFNDKCVSGGPELPGNPDNTKGITANRDRCRRHAEMSIMAVTALAPRIGYKEAAEVAQEALRSNRTVREVVLERKLVPEKELEILLDLRAMAEKKAA
jgi:fumarate hydratase class II